MFSLIFRLLSQLIFVALPLFATFKALQSTTTTRINATNPNSLKSWAKYWIVWATVSLVEPWIDILSPGLFFYEEFKFFFKLWLVLPKFDGASVIYSNYLEPALMRNEAQIESWMEDFSGNWRQLRMSWIKKLPVWLGMWIEGFFEVNPENKPLAEKPDNDRATTGLKRVAMETGLQLGQGLLDTMKGCLQYPAAAPRAVSTNQPQQRSTERERSWNRLQTTIPQVELISSTSTSTTISSSSSSDEFDYVRDEDLESKVAIITPPASPKLVKSARFWFWSDSKPVKLE